MNSRLFESNIGLPLALAPPVGLRHFQPAHRGRLELVADIACSPKVECAGISISPTAQASGRAAHLSDRHAVPVEIRRASVADRKQINLSQASPDERNGHQSKQYKCLVQVGLRLER